MQLSEMERRLAKIDREVVACCYGPCCLLSYKAVTLLRARGFKVRRLEDELRRRIAGRDDRTNRMTYSDPEA